MDPEVSDRFDNTRGLIERADGELLADLAATVSPEHAIVEVGSHTGLSSCWLAAGSLGAHVFCIDPWLDPIGDAGDDPFKLVTGDNVLKEFWHNVDRFAFRYRITPLRARSLDVAAMWVQPTGLVFIDALHGYGDVCDDARAWGPKVVPGGWIAFHDWFDDVERTHESQVADAIRDTLLRTDDWTDVQVSACNLWTARRR